MDSRNNINGNGSRRQISHHPMMARDLTVFFDSMKPGMETRSAHEREFEKVRDVVRAIGGRNQYDLVEINLGSFRGAMDFASAPLECVIVDKETTIRPELRNASLPIVYDSIELARFLKSSGYSGTLIDSTTKWRKHDMILPLNNDETKISHAEPSWETAIDNRYVPCCRQSRVLPPVLRIKSFSKPYQTNSQGELATANLSRELLLHPAHPTHLIRSNLLLQVWRINPGTFSMLTGILWLWMDSWAISVLSPYQCAWLVSCFIQSQYASQDTIVLDSPVEVWVRYDDLGEVQPIYELVSVPRTIQSGRSGDPLPDLVHKFFSFLSKLSRRSNINIFLPLSGATKKRGKIYQVESNEINRKKTTLVPVHVSQGVNPEPKPGDQTIFQNDALVLQDPLLPGHNITYSFTSQLLKVLCAQSSNAARILETGQPITEIFGGFNNSIVADNIAGSKLDEELAKSFKKFAYSESQLKTFFKIPVVSSHVLKARSQTIQSVQSVIQAHFLNENNPRTRSSKRIKYTVECFGSTCYGADHDTSDLDLVVIDSERIDGFSPNVDLNKLPPVYDVRKLSKALKKEGFRIHQVVSQATVPIVKIEDPRTGIKCDVNINEQLGLYNSKLIANYCKQNGYLRSLIVLIKEWAKSHGLNSPSGAEGKPTFSSYSLSIMTIGFLQMNKLLPNLQDKYALKNMEESMKGSIPEGEGYWMRTKKKTRIWCDTRFDTPKPLENQELSNTVLLLLLDGWFRYWGFQYDYGSEIMSIRDGGIIPRKVKLKVASRKKSRSVQNSTDAEENVEVQKSELVGSRDQPQLWEKQSLVVIDPFISEKNITGQIFASSIEKFVSECRRASFLLGRVPSFSQLLGDGPTPKAQGNNKIKKTSWRNAKKGSNTTATSTANSTVAASPSAATPTVVTETASRIPISAGGSETKVAITSM